MLWLITRGRGEIMSFLVCIKLSGKRPSSWRSMSWRTRRWHVSLSHVSRVTDPRSRIWRSLSDITTHYPMLESQIFLTLFWIWNYMCLYKLRNECLLKKIVQEIIQLYRLYCLYRLYTYKLELHQFYQSLINPMILKTSKLLYPLSIMKHRI